MTNEFLSFTTNYKIYNYEISTGSLTHENNATDFEMLGNIFISSMGKWFTEGNKIYFQNVLLSTYDSFVFL